jgi:hypothetical protein
VSDLSDMKARLDDLTEKDTELSHYAHAARMAVTG